jgi:hypothetical protein
MLVFLTSTWYLYAHYFNQTHGGYYTFNDLWPIWKLDATSIQKVWSDFTTVLATQMFSFPLLILCMILLIAIFILAGFRRIEKGLAIVVAVLLVGTVAYFLLWYQAFNVHDYYLIDVMLLWVAVMVVFFRFLTKHLPKFSGHWLFRLLVLGFLVFNMKYMHNNLHMRLFFPRCPPEQYERYTTGRETYWWWVQDYNSRATAAPYLGMEEYSRSIGIGKDDRVISMPDASINISLALMNQKGWTNFGFVGISDEDKMKKFISLGAMYLYVRDSEKPTSFLTE